MTMDEIDRLRGEANAALQMIRDYESGRISISSAFDIGTRDALRRNAIIVAGHALREARDRVESALREWWAQGCRALAGGEDRAAAPGKEIKKT